MHLSYYNSNKFRDDFSFEKRKAEADRIKSKFPDRVPIIVEKDQSSDIEDIDKKKYLVPYELQWGKFITVIRKRIKLGPERGLFIIVNNIMINSNEISVGQVYDLYKDEDGFLYTVYTGLNTFG